MNNLPLHHPEPPSCRCTTTQVAFAGCFNCPCATTNSCTAASLAAEPLCSRWAARCLHWHQLAARQAVDETCTIQPSCARTGRLSCIFLRHHLVPSPACRTARLHSPACMPHLLLPSCSRSLPPTAARPTPWKCATPCSSRSRSSSWPSRRVLASLDQWLLRWTACADQDVALAFLLSRGSQLASARMPRHPPFSNGPSPPLSPDQGLAALILLALPVCYSLMALCCLHASAAATGAWDALVAAQGAGACGPQVACLAWPLQNCTACALRRQTCRCCLPAAPPTSFGRSPNSCS